VALMRWNCPGDRWLGRGLTIAADLGVVLAAATATLLRDHVDACGQPADLPAVQAGYLACTALLLGVGGLLFSLKSSIGSRRSVDRFAAGLAGAAVVGSVTELGWVFLARFHFCF